MSSLSYTERIKKKEWECKVNVRKYWKRFYSIHTEIYLVKSYCSCLWLDERCIFTVVRFVLKSVNLCVYKIKTSYHGKCTRMIFSHSLRCIKKLTRSLRSVVLFFFFIQRWFVNKNRSCALSKDRQLWQTSRATSLINTFECLKNWNNQVRETRALYEWLACSTRPVFENRELTDWSNTSAAKSDTFQMPDSNIF